MFSSRARTMACFITKKIITKTMEVRIQIADEVYRRMLVSENRVKGSIGLVSPTEGNFNAWKVWTPESSESKTIRLRHGKAYVDSRRTRLMLSIDHTEEVRPYDVIDQESQQASDFVYDVFDE